MPVTLNFKEAITKHLHFKSRLRAILYGEISKNENPVCSQYECPVGQWIYTEALANYHHIEEVIQLEKVHADLHEIARKLVYLNKKGKVEVARKGLAEMEVIADKLVVLLTEVEMQVNDATSILSDGNEETEQLLNDLLKQHELLDEKIIEQEKGIRQQAAFYSKLLSVSPAVLWMTNEQNEIIYMNETWFKWVDNINKNELTESLLQSIHPAEKENVLKIYKNSFDTKQNFEVQYKMVEINGIVRHCLATGQPYYNAENIFSGFTGSVVDVTGMVKAEAILDSNLNNEKEVLNNLFMQVPAALCILRGPNHIFELTNLGFKELIGDANVIGKTFKEAFPELAGQGFLQLLDNVYKTKNPFVGNQIPINIKRENGQDLRYINFIYEPFANLQNEMEGIFVFAYDVTEMVLAKTAIQNSEEELKNVIDSAPFPIGVYIGKELRIHIANQSIINIFGKGPDVIGKSYKKLLPELENQQIIAQMDAVLDTGLPFHAKDIKVDINHGENINSYYFNYSFTPLKDVEGNTYGLMNTAADVTEVNVARIQLEQSEKRFRSMANFMPQFVWTADKEGNLNYYNQAVYNYSDHTEASLVAAGWLSIVHPNDREENVKLWVQAVTKGTDFNFEHRFKKHTGEYRWQLSRAVPLKDEDGQIQSWLGISTDIQDQKNFTNKLEKMVNERTNLLRQANYDLERSNNELTQFAYVASHDLQEPLRKIKTFISRIKDDHKLSEDIKTSYLEKIHGSAERMSNLIQDILEFSSVGKANEQKVKTDLNIILNETLNDLELTIQNKQAEIIISEMPTLKVIPTQMQQLFHNLISNSIKFATSGKKLVISIIAEKIKGQEIPKEYLAKGKEDYFKITFKDTGIGFDQQYANLIFTIFQRLHQKSMYEGTGIGLALCKRIMDNHNGFIYASSKENEGATFFVYLPA